ncbi:hypothetical protein HK405_007790 [Cladochytrium tenue]|nr:hypothetical protein HK405_007790 [Cladochytrium tenue]
MAPPPPAAEAVAATTTTTMATGATAATTRLRQAAAPSSKAVRDADITSVVSNPSDRFARDWQRPTFSIKELRDAVPADCFQRSALRSLSYVARDLAMAALLGYLATHIDAAANLAADVTSAVATAPPLGLAPDAVAAAAGWAGFVARWGVLWPAYWVAQGAVLTGVWVLAHECGHRAFSDYAWLDATVGWVLHSALLVPYFSWKITHGKHHKANAHMERDQVFVPKTRSQFFGSSKDGKGSGATPSPRALAALRPALDAAPLLDTLLILRQQLFGWPAYLVANVSGQDYGRWTSHFDPSAPIFSPAQFAQVVASDVGVALALGLLWRAVSVFGPGAVICYYGVPYLWVNHWLVMITYLQHTDARVPHYAADAWDFVAGALATVDRDFGPILNELHHHIADTHVAHHLFSTMPHYNAQRATAALREKLGKHYMYEGGGLPSAFAALFRSFRECRFVEDDLSVRWYKAR